MPEDDVLLKRVKEGIEALNNKYWGDRQEIEEAEDMESRPSKERGHFFLFHRARRWNPKENVWMGWERKRGKLEDFNEALRGNSENFALIIGATEQLKRI